VKRGGRIALSNPDSVLMPETDERARELLVEVEEAVENDEIDWEICEFLFLLRVSSVADWYDGVTELEQNQVTEPPCTRSFQEVVLFSYFVLDKSSKSV
jgi:hypothetical protein